MEQQTVAARYTKQSNYDTATLALLANNIEHCKTSYQSLYIANDNQIYSTRRENKK